MDPEEFNVEKYFTLHDVDGNGLLSKQVHYLPFFAKYWSPIFKSFSYNFHYLKKNKKQIFIFKKHIYFFYTVS